VSPSLRGRQWTTLRPEAERRSGPRYSPTTENLNGLVLYAVFAAIFFYLLYGVIRAGVRDGILAADRRRVAEASDRTGSNLDDTVS
jgi:hypothetical protein